MSLIEYINNNFQCDINSLNTSRCNNIINENNPYINADTLFFGGPSWENFNKDIITVNPGDRAYFCFCLFAMVAADQNAHAHFKDVLFEWLEHYKYPKFGWCGFGPHFENVCYLLEVPSTNGIDFDTITDAELDAFVQLQFENGRSVLGNLVNDFFGTMLKDEDFRCDLTIFERLVNRIQNLIV